MFERQSVLNHQNTTNTRYTWFFKLSWQWMWRSVCCGMCQHLYDQTLFWEMEKSRGNWCVFVVPLWFDTLLSCCATV